MSTKIIKCHTERIQNRIQCLAQHSDPVFLVYFHYLPMISGILTPFPQNNKSHFIDKIVIDVKMFYVKANSLSLKLFCRIAVSFAIITIFARG